MIEPPSPLLSDKMEIKSSSKTWLDLKVLLANPLNSSIVTSLLSKRVWSSFSIRLWTPGWLWNRCALKTRSNNPGYFYRNKWGGEASQLTEKCLKLLVASTPDWKRQIELFERTFSGQFSGNAECRSLCPMKGPRTGSGYPKASLEGRGILPTKNAEPEKMDDFKRLHVVLCLTLALKSDPMGDFMLPTSMGHWWTILQ